jgi:hypothetical protein
MLIPVTLIFVTKASGCVIPKRHVFTSGARNLARSRAPTAHLPFAISKRYEVVTSPMLRGRMPPPPKKLPIDHVQVEATGGPWLLVVEKIVETQGTANLLIGIMLEQNIGNESFRMRRLDLVVDKYAVRDPNECPNFLSRIGKWIETTEGDGFLDLAHSHD